MISIKARRRRQRLARAKAFQIIRRIAKETGRPIREVRTEAIRMFTNQSDST